MNATELEAIVVLDDEGLEVTEFVESWFDSDYINPIELENWEAQQ